MDLLSELRGVPDPRSDKNKLYPLEEILLLCICAIASGADGWESIAEFGEDKLAWLGEFLPYKNGLPSEGCLGWVMARLPGRGCCLDAVGGTAHGRRGGRDRRQDPASLA